MQKMNLLHRDEKLVTVLSKYCKIPQCNSVHLRATIANGLRLVWSGNLKYEGAWAPSFSVGPQNEINK